MIDKLMLYAYRIMAIFIPALIILYVVLHTGILPDNDYWGILGQILTNEGFTHSFSSWLSRANEHIVVIPKVIFALNILLTHGNNTSLSLITWSIALVQVLLLITIIPPEIWNSRIKGTLLLLIISMFIFTPKAMHNWTLGMSGIMWITANLFIVASVISIYRFYASKQIGWLLGSLIAGLVSSFCYSTSLALWPALLIGGVLLRFKMHHLILIALTTIIAYIFFIIGYVHPSHHPGAEKSIWQIILFMLNFLGGIFISGHDYRRFGKILALLGIMLSVLVVWLDEQKDNDKYRKEYIPWVMLQIYAICNALLSGISRSGMGLQTALTSRYATLPAFFWLGLCAMWLLHFWHTDRLRLYLPIPSAVIAILIYQMYFDSYGLYHWAIQREDRKAVATISLLTETFDESIINEVVTHDPLQFQVILSRLKHVKHVPFDKWPENYPHLGVKMDIENIPSSDDEKYFGWFDTITPFSYDCAKVYGWAYIPTGKIHCIAIVNQDGIVRGLAIPILDRPDVAASLNIDINKVGWEGYTHIVDSDKELLACAMIDCTDQWFRLKQTHSIPHNKP